MPTLKQLLLDGNQLAGALPQTWGSAGAMPSLQTLSMASNGVGGQLPPTWCNDARSLPDLQVDPKPSRPIALTPLFFPLYDI